MKYLYYNGFVKPFSGVRLCEILTKKIFAKNSAIQEITLAFNKNYPMQSIGSQLVEKVYTQTVEKPSYTRKPHRG